MFSVYMWHEFILVGIGWQNDLRNWACGSGYFSYFPNASTPRYLLILYRVYRVYHVSFYSHFVQNIQSFIIKK